MPSGWRWTSSGASTSSQVTITGKTSGGASSTWTFLPEARPLATEGIAATTAQLYALCRQREINHLIYIGFAINWCLLLSPGGMAAMQRHGLLCSTIRQAVTAVENRETTREQGAKEIALWRVALAFGFVFDAEGIIAALNGPLGAGDDAARATT